MSASRIATSRDFRQIQPLAQQVDADNHVVDAQPKVAQDLDAFQGIDLAVEILDLHAQIGQVFGQIFGHTFRERRDQGALANGDASMHLMQQVFDLSLGRPALRR